MNVPDHLHHRVSELITLEQDGADKRRLWAVVLGLTPKLDGDQWCVLWGANLQEGVAAFGSSPQEEVIAFEHAMYKSAAQSKPGGEKGK